MLAKSGTCSHCGYEKHFCMCNSENQHGTIYPRNTSGETRKFQHYDSYNQDDYSRTSPIFRQDTAERKFMEELNPVDGEPLVNYIKRSELGATKLIESSMYKHIFGGKKPWPSHTTTRYCPICTLCQHVETFRQILIFLEDVIDVKKITIKVTQAEPNQPYGYTSISLNIPT